MRDFYFDKLIWEKLHGLEVPFDPSDWEEMEFDLDQSDELFEQSSIEDSTTVLAAGEEVFVELIPNDFDLKIREKLSTLLETPIPQDWEEMELALEEGAFDFSVAQKLEGLSLPFVDADWNILAADLDESPFDASVREALADYQVPYNPSDWHDLSDRLSAPFDQAIRHSLGNFIFSFSRKDWRHMAAILNQAAISEGLAEPAWYANWKNYISAASVIALLFLTSLWSGEIHNLSRPEKSFVEYHAPVFQPENGKAMSESFSGQWQPHELPGHDLLTNKQITPVNSSSKTPAKTNGNSSEISSDNSGIIIPMRPVYEEMFPGNFEHSASQAKNTDHTTTEIPLISMIDGFDAPDIQTLAPLHTLPDYSTEPVQKIRPEPGIRVGVYGGQTRTKAELSNRPETGFMAGTRLEFLINDNWSVVSGIHYSMKQFRFEYQIFAPQRFDRAVDANLKMIEAPLLIRYNFPSTTPLNLYALTGIVTTVSISENYWEYDPRSPDNQGVDRNLLRQQNLPTDERSLNTYVGNIYVAGGLEYQFGDHFALQVEPYFQMNVQRTKGSGARGFEKQLYTSGLSLSFMYNLSKHKN
ncbi:MAG: porin family protein [Bacteroidia bacterium]